MEQRIDLVNWWILMISIQIHPLNKPFLVVCYQSLDGSHPPRPPDRSHNRSTSWAMTCTTRGRLVQKYRHFCWGLESLDFTNCRNLENIWKHSACMEFLVKQHMKHLHKYVLCLFCLENLEMNRRTHYFSHSSLTFTIYSRHHPLILNRFQNAPASAKGLLCSSAANHCKALHSIDCTWSIMVQPFWWTWNILQPVFSGPPTMSFQLLRHFKRFSLADTTCHVLKEGWDMASHILLRKRRQQNAWGCDWRGFRNSEGHFFPRQSCSPGSFTVALRVTTALHEDSAFLLSKQQTIHPQNPPGPLCQTMPSVHVRRVSECMQTKDPLSEPRL